MVRVGKWAQLAGCCGASCKKDCRRPPCPCNLQAWDPLERVELRKQQAA